MTLHYKRLFTAPLCTAVVSRCVLAIFILVSVFGIFICAALFMNMARPMEHGMNTPSFTCALGRDVANTNLCPMSIIEHIGSWQQLFAAVVPSDLLGLLLLPLVVAVGYGVGLVRPYSASPPLSVVRLRLYHRRQRNVQLHNYFLHIFARGILQPKLFAS